MKVHFINDKGEYRPRPEWYKGVEGNLALMPPVSVPIAVKQEKKIDLATIQAGHGYEIGDSDKPPLLVEGDEEDDIRMLAMCGGDAYFKRVMKEAHTHREQARAAKLDFLQRKEEWENRPPPKPNCCVRMCRCICGCLCCCCARRAKKKKEQQALVEQQREEQGQKRGKGKAKRPLTKKELKAEAKNQRKQAKKDKKQAKHDAKVQRIVAKKQAKADKQATKDAQKLLGKRAKVHAS